MAKKRPSREDIYNRRVSQFGERYPNGASRGIAVPDHDKAEAVYLHNEGLSLGRRARDVDISLGFANGTTHRWKKEREQPRGLKSVKRGPMVTYSMCMPNGAVVRGLSLADIIHIAQEVDASYK